MRCPRSPAKKRPLGRSAPSAARNRSCGDADVLRLVHHDEVEGRLLAARQLGGQSAEHRCARDHGHLLAGRRAPLEDGPQRSALRLRQPGLSAQALDVAIRLPAVQLPRIDHLFPFGKQKGQAELLTGHLAGCGGQQASDLIARGNVAATEVRSRRAARRWRRSSARRGARPGAARC